jgi:hypothetical protein
MKSHTVLALSVWTIAWQGLAASERVSIDRTLRREPAYRTKSAYCLLLLGPEAKTRVWLVTSGEAFYADTNSDGDLTEPGKRIYSIGNYRDYVFLDPDTRSMWFPVPENERIYNVGDIFDKASRSWYHVTVRRYGKLKTATFEVLVDRAGKFRQLGRLNRFGDTSRDAPVLYFDGPLTLGLFTTNLVSGQDTNQIEAWVGTDVPVDAIGQPTYLVVNDWIPPSIFPMARLEFPSKAPDGKPLETTVLLDRREFVRFHGRAQIPEKATAGNVKTTLAIPNWDGHKFRPISLEIPLVDAHTPRGPQ